MAGLTATGPDDTDARLGLAVELAAQGDAAGATRALRDAIRLAPEQLEVLSRIGDIAIRLDSPLAIAEAQGRILGLEPHRINAMINLGTALARLGQIDKALAWHRQAATLAPDNAAAHMALAQTSRALHDVDGSIAACERVLLLAPDHADVRVTLASNLAAQGDFVAAERYCREALALKPASAEAGQLLAGIRAPVEDGDELPRLRARLDDAAAPRRERIVAGMALGSLLDRNEEHDAAFAAFAAANRMLRAQWAEAGRSFNAAAERAHVDWCIATFTPKMFETTASWGDPSELPVFVVGMPRSGTSLVEQIAASHKLVFGAGERNDIGTIFHVPRDGAVASRYAQWGAREVRAAASGHVALLRALGRDAARVIDKMPDNIRLLGRIAVLFPRARIVVCRRDLRDVGLSCHFQQFAHGNAWTTDLAELAERARLIERLLAHWLTVLPDRILQVRYEDLVTNPEPESRRLIDFLGLQWDPACLAFHETKRPVMTASMWQVRQPVYRGSIGRWRNYRAHLGPLLEGLKGLEPNDD